MSKRPSSKSQTPVRSNDIRSFFSKTPKTNQSKNDKKDESPKETLNAEQNFCHGKMLESNQKLSKEKEDCCGEYENVEGEKIVLDLEASDVENVETSLSPPCKKRKMDSGSSDSDIILAQESPKSQSFQSNIVTSPNFKLVDAKYGGNSVKYLFIFDVDNKNLAYKYRFKPEGNIFVCCKCTSKNKHVWAKLKNKQNGEEYVELSPQKHCCDLQEIELESVKKSLIARNYIIQGKTRIEYFDFQVVKRKVDGKIIQKLVIFDPKDKTLCFEYKWNSNANKFECQKCMKNYKIDVSARLLRNEKYEQYLNLGKKPHQCKLQKFAPESDQLPPSDEEPKFVLVKRKHRKTFSQHLMVFDEKDKSLCFDLTWNASNQQFSCNTCLTTHRINVKLKLLQNESGEEYISHGTHQHKCLPKKFITKNSGFNSNQSKNETQK